MGILALQIKTRPFLSYAPHASPPRLAGDSIRKPVARDRAQRSEEDQSPPIDAHPSKIAPYRARVKRLCNSV